MERIVFLDRNTVHTHFRPPGFAHEWIDYATTSETEIVERLQDATIAITNKIPLRASSLVQLPQLKLIVVAATGYDCVDLNYCRAHQITVCNVRQYSSQSVAEHVIMLLLNLLRNFPVYQAEVQNGEWQRATTFCLNATSIRDLQNCTLGIIGQGAIGQRVAVLAQSFGMNVLWSERKNAQSIRPGKVAFDEVLRACDAISLHCPLTPDTRGLIGAAELAAMKPDAVLVNCSRGGLIDESALVRALQAGTIAAAGVDVLTQEPPVLGNPLLAVQLPNLIVTPHNAWASVQSQQNLADQLIQVLESFQAGMPMNVIE